MKGRLYKSGLILLMFIVAVGSILFFGKKVEVSAASTVFVNQPYNVHFSHQLDAQSIQGGKIYVTTTEGDKVDAPITLQENKQSLAIVNKEPGEYILHIEKKAFKKSAVQKKKQTIEYKVIEKIEHVASVKDLEDFFQTVINNEKHHFVNQNETAEEASVVSETSNSTKASADTSASSGGSHSTTNNQVEDIEEGDIVVTDGKYIYTTIDNNILITDASNPKAMKQTSKIALPQNSYPMQLMVHGKTLIVVFDQFIEQKAKMSTRFYGGTSMTKVALYDIEDAANPKLLREFGQEGHMNGVRKYNDVLYIVTNYTPHYWIMSEEQVELRPSVSDSVENYKISPMEVENISILPGAMEPNYTIISTIDLNNLKNKQIETKGFLGGSSTLYMSKNALYLTAFDYGMPIDVMPFTSNMVDSIVAPTASKTDIYKFAIDGMDVELAGSASVEGNVLNQFSMDEYDGNFRIATTEGNAWGDNASSKNHLFIFDEKLEKIGEVRDLAKGERIYSARFMGDKAYLVTFKETDPLFVIDVANPKQPKVLGELKIPGFSNYLHPLDEKHLIGIGYDTETRVDSYSKQPFIITTGIKLSLFDVSDFANPKEKDSVVIGGRGTYSEISYNHKALFRNEEHHYYGFPITIYEAKGEFDIQYKGSGAQIYEVTAENGITLKGDLVTPAKQGQLYDDWESNITRLMYIDDALYTVSRDGINSYDLQTFNRLGSVKLK